MKDDPLAPSRGIINGIIISSVLWIIILLIILWIVT